MQKYIKIYIYIKLATGWDLPHKLHTKNIRDTKNSKFRILFPRKRSSLPFPNHSPPVQSPRLVCMLAPLRWSRHVFSCCSNGSPAWSSVRRTIAAISAAQRIKSPFFRSSSVHGKIPRWWPPLEGDSSKKDREIVYGWSVVFRNSTIKRGRWLGLVNVWMEGGDTFRFGILDGGSQLRVEFLFMRKYFTSVINEILIFLIIDPFGK